MNRTEQGLLDAAIRLAVEEEFERETEQEIPPTEIPAELNRRVRRIIRRNAFRQFWRNHAGSVTAACLCLLLIGAGVGIPLAVEAGEPAYDMLTSQDTCRENLSVQFRCRDADTVSDTPLKPRSAAEVLTDFTLEHTYRTESVYIEEYDGVRYEQTLLSAEGQVILPAKGKNIRNIVIRDYSAVLVFDSETAAIVWRDGRYSYLLEGAMSGDDAMRYARMIGE